MARSQGRCISPQTVWVQVVSLDDGHVFYRKSGETQTHQTPEPRFREVVCIGEL